MAGVSYQTVSRVLNDAPDVSTATRVRVQQIIKDMGYRRSRAATALSTSRSTAIGILTDGSPRFGPVGTLMALEKVARQKGCPRCLILAAREGRRDERAGVATPQHAGPANNANLDR